MLESRLLQGCCDIHLHVAPSLIPRSADIVTVARQAEAAGYRAIVIKDHHYNSAPACDRSSGTYLTDLRCGYSEASP